MGTNVRKLESGFLSWESERCQFTSSLFFNSASAFQSASTLKDGDQFFLFVIKSQVWQIAHLVKSRQVISKILAHNDILDIVPTDTFPGNGAYCQKA